jgi:hypothetical protein
MIKPARSTYPSLSDNTFTSQNSNGKNDQKIKYETTSAQERTPNVDKFKGINLYEPMNERNKMVLPAFPQKTSAERKQSDSSILDIKGLDNIFTTMKNRLKSEIKNENLACEKFKISRAINLLFKNNLSELTINEFKIRENTTNMMSDSSNALMNVNHVNPYHSINSTSKDKMLFSTINEARTDKNITLFNVDNTQPGKIESK